MRRKYSEEISFLVEISAMDFSQVQILLFSSLYGVIDNDIQASIISKESNRAVNVYNNAINI